MSTLLEEIDPLCPTGYRFDKEKCDCVKDDRPDEIEPQCPPDYIFNLSSCQCEKKPTPIDIEFRFNEGSDFRDTPESGDNLVSDKPALILMNGDYGIKTNTPEEWCNEVMKMVKDSGIPVWGTVGNHDGETEYLRTGFFKNTSWSWILKKSFIAFVAADTEAENVAETEALIKDAQNDPNIDKIIVLMHESVFHPEKETSVTSDTTLEFHTMYMKYPKVRLVLAGHTHVFGMSIPIDNILYVMCGIGGQSPSTGPTTPAPFHKINGVLHFTVFTDKSIKCDCVPNAGDAPGIMWTFYIGPKGELPTNGIKFIRRD
jgi:predicted phosphodiesterase